MKIVSMGAGLGNQMFEYAFYTYLCSLYPNEEIKIDSKYAFPLAHNGIELFDIFSLEAEEATETEVLKLTGGYGLNGENINCQSSLRKFIREIKNRIIKCPETMRIQADYTEYYEDFFDVDENQSVYYLGPFANYLYFSKIQERIKQIYCFPPILDKSNLYYKQLIEKCNSVSVHVRRGDYITNGIELVPSDFYTKAMCIMKKKVENPTFFIFSDDVAYVRELFDDGNRYIFVVGNSGRDSFRDMQLMSLCRHNIIANSTFSFWGAFLNSNSEKIVIAPNMTFTGCKYPFSCHDWERI